MRYRPSVQADLQAYAGQLALLASDCAEADPRDLAAAVRKHVRQSPFLPKACELLELAEEARWLRVRKETPPLPSPDLEKERLAQEQYSVWSLRLAWQHVPQAEIDDKPDRWKRIAETQGHLRLKDGQYTQRRKFAVEAN